MKKIHILTVLTVILIFSTIFTSHCQSESLSDAGYTFSKIEHFENDTHYFFFKSKTAFYISILGNEIKINKISYGKNTIVKSFSADDEVKGCEYIGSTFYFHIKTKEKNIKITSFNFDRSTLNTFEIGDFKNNNRFLLSADKSGCFYTINENNQYQLIQFSKKGIVLNRYDFDDRILQILTYDGSKTIVITGSSCYTVGEDSVVKLSDKYIGFPASMLSKRYIACHGNIYDTENDCQLLFKSNLPADTDGEGLFYSVKDNIYYKQKGKKQPVSMFSTEQPINELYQNSMYLFAVSKAGITIVKKSSMKEIPKTPLADITPNTTIDKNIFSRIFKLGNGYITDVQKRTTVKSFEKSIYHDGYTISFYFNGIPITSGYVKTGTKVIFTAQDEKAVKYTIVVKGDVNSDGNVNNKDLNLYTDYLLGSKSINNNEKLAADTNQDHILNNIDLINIARMRH